MRVLMCSIVLLVVVGCASPGSLIEFMERKSAIDKEQNVTVCKCAYLRAAGYGWGRAVKSRGNTDFKECADYCFRNNIPD